MNKCGIPSVYCGNKTPIPTKNLQQNLKYNRKGTSIECLKKGINTGIYLERNKNLPESSLKNIKYIGDYFEEKFISKRINTVQQLINKIQLSSQNNNKRFLENICKNRAGNIDYRVYNSIIHFVYHNSNREVVRKLPECKTL